MRWRCVTVSLSVFALAALGAASWANDARVEGVGGAIRLMRDHPTIRMLEERVVVDLSPENAEIDCRFVFQNDGPATTVQMGFPEEAGGDVSVRQPHGFLHFATWVDGRPTPARIAGFEALEAGWRRWRVKSVRFARGQERLVQVRYGMRPGESITGSRFFHYRLDTGGSWKGPIGEAEVLVRLHGFRGYWPVSAEPRGYVRKADSITWRWKDFEPLGTEDAAQAAKAARVRGALHLRVVGVSFFPAYLDFVVNGEPVRRWLPPGPAPTLEDSQAWASLRALAEWTGGRTEWNDATRTAILRVGKSTASLRPGSRQALADGKTVDLGAAPRFVRGALFVPVGEVIRALGGTSRFHKKTGTTYLTLPGKSGPGES